MIIIVRSTLITTVNVIAIIVTSAQDRLLQSDKTGPQMYLDHHELDSVVIITIITNH